MCAVCCQGLQTSANNKYNNQHILQSLTLRSLHPFSASRSSPPLPRNWKCFVALSTSTCSALEQVTWTYCWPSVQRSCANDSPPSSLLRTEISTKSKAELVPHTFFPWDKGGYSLDPPSLCRRYEDISSKVYETPKTTDEMVALTQFLAVVCQWHRPFVSKNCTPLY